MNIQQIKEHTLNTNGIDKLQALLLVDCDLDELCAAANEIRKEKCGNGFDMCTIINGKSGRCSENCKYCAQSAHYHVHCEEYELLPAEEILKEALYNHEKGVLRYSVVTSGKKLSDSDVNRLCETYQTIKSKCDIELCCSHGLLNYAQFKKLKESGVTRCHNNLETSRRFFPQICTTHSYDEKIATIQAAQKAGLSVCSGGILGLGETMEDRIDMAFLLKELGIKSVPINVLNPIKGTPLENNSILSEQEVRRTIAIYRFILPNAAIRLAGGRGLFADKGESMFQSGANAAITGDMLTTSGISIADDIAMTARLGFEVKPL